jgi:hypothetical protein
MGLVMRSSLNIISQVADDIELTGQRRVMQAARHVRKKIVENLKATYPKVSGDLFKGVAVEGREGNLSNVKFSTGVSGGKKAYVIVGATAPAYHAHILESGTKVRTTPNAFGRKGVSVSSGKVEGKHTFENTFEREANAVQEILSGTWVK